jgi:hypothetical protein
MMRRRALLLASLLWLAACPGPVPDKGYVDLGPGVKIKPQDLVPFTTDLREEFQLTADQLKRVQFYVSDDITLQATRMSGQTMVAGGKLRKVGETLVEEVFIESLTLCVAREIDASELRVNFNASLSTHLLGFGDDGKSGGRYVLFARRWENDIGQLNYGGSEFLAVEHSARAHLLVRKDLVENMRKDRRVEPGVKVEE